MLARIRKSMQERDQGFTLIELLVVMIIIGILAAIAIPVFLNQRQKAVDSAAEADLNSIAEQVAVHVMEFDEIPSVTIKAGANGGRYYELASPAATPVITARNIGPVSLTPEQMPTATTSVVPGGSTATDWSYALVYSGGTEGDLATMKYSVVDGLVGPTKKTP